MNYFIFSYSSDYKKFQLYISDYVQKGWIPTGSPWIEKFTRPYNRIETIFYQAMYLPLERGSKDIEKIDLNSIENAYTKKEKNDG